MKYLLLILWPDRTVAHSSLHEDYDAAREASARRNTSGLAFNFARSSSREWIAKDFASEKIHLIRLVEADRVTPLAELTAGLR